MNATSDWLFNLMLWGGIVTLLVLLFHVFVAPILGVAVLLIGAAFVAVVSGLWPKW